MIQLHPRRNAADLLALTLLLVLCLLMAPPALARSGGSGYRIGVLLDSPWRRHDDLIESLLERTRAMLPAGSPELVAPSTLRGVGDGTAEGVVAAARVLQRERPDLVLTAGPLSRAALEGFGLPTLELLPLTESPSGTAIRALPAADPVRALAALRSLVPARKPALVASRATLEHWRESGLIAALAENTDAVEPIAIEAGHDEALEALRAVDVDSAILAPLPMLSETALIDFAEAMTAAGIASVSLWGPEDVRAGMLLSPPGAPGTDDLATALADRIRGDGGAGPREPLAATGTFNRATADRLGLDAAAPAGYRELEASAVSASRTLSLLDAVSEAMARNLDVRAGAADLRAGAARAERARAGLLPSLEARVEGRRIDEDRADASNGRAPEYRTGGVLELRQVLYSEEALAEHRVQRLLQQARIHQQEGVVLDAVLEAGTGYLEVLRTRARARIRRENLALTRSNLERARTRLELGVANRSELYRWQAELASARAALARSEARAEGARLELNRIMDHPPGDRWRTLDPHLSDPWLLIPDPRILEFLEDPRKRPVLRDFLVREALDHAPALAQARREVEARERSLVSARRSFTRPSLVAGAMLDKKFSQHGAGRDELDFDFADVFPGLPADGSTQIGGDVDNLEWSVGVRASLPLYQGGERFAAVDEERALLDRATLQADHSRARIRTRVLSRARVAEASFDAISWARDAARSARDNLELVTEAYDRGVVTVIDVLDAQTTALAAELDAAAALYDFLADYLALQRATGRFDLIADEDQRRAMRERLEAFAAGA